MRRLNATLPFACGAPGRSTLDFLFTLVGQAYAGPELLGALKATAGAFAPWTASLSQADDAGMCENGTWMGGGAPCIP